MSENVFRVEELPTPLAATAARVNVLGTSASADSFLAVSYVFEAVLKTIVLALHAGIKTASADVAYRFAFALVRADGLGNWEQVLREMSTPPVSGFVPREMSTLVAWLTKKRTQESDQWAKTAYSQLASILILLGTEVDSPSRLNVAHLISVLVQIRNKTKAHGAVGEDFFAAANAEYASALSALLMTCPALQWQWVRIYQTPTNQLRKIVLKGGTAQKAFDDSDGPPFLPTMPEGVYVVPEKSLRPFFCGSLFRCDRQCQNFLWPNGGFSSASAKAEFLDYHTGVTKSLEVSEYISPPAPLPPSETHTEFNLEIHSNVFGNLPEAPRRYIQRPKLQAQLLDRLTDTNHPIITLHGRGGVGKTYLALFAAHYLAELATPFEYIIWLSARDVDLRTHGPGSVRQDVVSLNHICEAVGNLFGINGSTETFAMLLQEPTTVTGETGILFVLDNFETLAEVREIHEFLDSHTHLPNKVLITSRERAFKADYPIEVRGMEFDEAERMLRQTATELGIGPLLTLDVITELYEYTDGHAYAMRVLAGEIAKEGKPVPLKNVLPRRLDIVQAVFERSFNKLSEAGRRVFLVVAGFKSLITEIALIIVLGQREIDVERGLDECVRLSLIEATELIDGSTAFLAPQLARLFAQKKLDGDPHRLLIQEDLETIREFGVINPREVKGQRQTDAIKLFVQFCLRRAESASSDERSRIATMLESVANVFPNAWLSLYDFHERYAGSTDEKRRVLRSAVEEMPYNKNAWLKAAQFAEHIGDETSQISYLVSAVDADPNDVSLVRDVSYQLSAYVNAHLHEIPKTLRGVYVASVRAHMERLADQLDATGLSRLAWLFLLEEDRESAWKYANMGCGKDATNSHCINILERLEREGFEPPKC